MSERNWDHFLLSSIFSEISRGKRLIRENQVPGSTPYVSSSSLNNGVDNLIGNVFGRSFSNCLTIANSGSVGSTFYHPYKFIASDHVTSLKRSGLSKYQYLYLASRCTVLSGKYNFNREINDKRIRAEKIILPCNQQNNPDFEYMEAKIESLYNRKIAKYYSYIKKKLSSVRYVELPSLSEVNWDAFYIKDIFKLVENTSVDQLPTGAYIHKDYLSPGNTPRVTVTSSNNGIDSFWESTHKNKREFKNIISLSFLGNSFYHPYSVTLDMKVHALSLKGIILNEFVAQFICVMLTKNTTGNNYGYQLSSTMAPHKRILLPVTKEGLPDYEYMSQYVMNIEYMKISNYLRYLNLENECKFET